MDCKTQLKGLALIVNLTVNLTVTLTVALALALTSLSCQQAPTVLTTESKTVLVKEPSVRKLITAKTVLVDARSPFEFGLSHIPGSINLQWQDFSVPSNPNKGFLDSNRFALARRLALVGVGPETPVLVIGSGREGDGQEGRLAWMFKVLGVEKVGTVKYDLLRAQMANGDSARRPESQSVWKPQEDSKFEMSYEDFYTLVKAYHIQHRLPWVSLPKGVLVGRSVQGAHLFVLDVRKPKEMLTEAGAEDFVDATAVVKIPWDHFWNEMGIVSHQGADLLRQSGVGLSDSIVVLSENGMTASGVVFALNELGFESVRILPGGLSYLQSLRAENSSKK